jgi:hypothetical protein
MQDLTLMSDDELRSYATTELGLRLGPRSSRDTIMQRIQQASGDVPQKNEVPDHMKRVRIEIHKTGDPNEVDPVFVGVKGYTCTINRGEPVSVPEMVVEALDHAILTTYHDVINPLTGAITTESRDSKAYPYTRL